MSTSHAAALDAAAFGLEQQPAYSFSLACKRGFSPILSHQFEVAWPWPPRRGRSTARAADTDPATSSAEKREEVSIKKEDDGDVAAAQLPGADGAVSATDADDATSSSWCERRRYGPSTCILDFTSDPFMGQLDGRRVAMLLSPGHRCWLPLERLAEPETLPDHAGLAYWRTTYKPPLSPPTTSASPSSTSLPASGPPPPPCCAELVLGELPAIERAVWLRRKSAGNVAGEGLPSNDAAASAPTSRLTSSATARAPALAPGRGAHLRDAQLAVKPVQTFFFYTVPYRVRWLSQVRGRLVASLPCEERLVTLHAPHAPQPAGSVEVARLNAPADWALTSVQLEHSFPLARGVVPLDVAEVFERPFLAVGTAEHGVLLCGIDPATGAIQSVARVISLKGTGSVLYPVAHVAAVFPPRRADAAAAADAAGRLRTPAWAAAAAALESLREGALVCSSPYEPTATVVKLGAAAGGVVEDTATARGIDTILSVGTAVHPGLGPLVCTASRGLLRLFITDAAAAEEARRPTGGVAERVPPCLAYERVARFDTHLLCVTGGPVIHQEFRGNYVSHRSYTKHWQLAADSTNRLMLLDRSTVKYLTHSVFQLHRRTAQEAEAAPPGSLLPCLDAPVSESQPSVTTTTGEAGEEEAQESGAAPAGAGTGTRGRGAKKGAVKTEPDQRDWKASKLTARGRSAVSPLAVALGTDDGTGGRLVQAQALATAVAVEDACSGIVALGAQSEVVQVAAAHDRNCVSLVTWRVAPPRSMSAALAAAAAASDRGRSVALKRERDSDAE